MKILIWVKNKLADWFGITDLMRKQVELIDQLACQKHDLTCLEMDYRQKIERADRLLKFLDESRVGLDVSFGYDRSWAVVCLGGHPDLVKFYQFPDEDVRTINDFLRNFDRNERKERHYTTMDAPLDFCSNYFRGRF